MPNKEENTINNIDQNIDKKAIITKVISQLQNELTLALLSADNAHKAAIDDQSVAETQYDTLAIEQSYLAEGQSRRVNKIRQDIESLKTLQSRLVTDKKKVLLGSLVQLEQGIAKQQWFFITPAAGGYCCQMKYMATAINVTLITTQSPMGSALLGKTLDDEVNILFGNNTRCDFITEIQ